MEAVEYALRADATHTLALFGGFVLALVTGSLLALVVTR